MGILTWNELFSSVLKDTTSAWSVAPVLGDGMVWIGFNFEGLYTDKLIREEYSIHLYNKP